jgi:hypothetical protein
MKAIVTLAVGEKYISIFDKYCRPNWQKYADTFGYDLIVIKEALDNSERAKQRSPSWQKLLILSQNWSDKYDQIVWIDTDVIINNNNAYDICAGVPVEKVGAVETYSIPTRDLHQIALQRLYDNWKLHCVPYIDNMTPEKYYLNRGIPGNGIDNIVQAGVFVCSPKYHKNIFEKIYTSYEDTHGAEWNYEMPAMSYELIKNEMVHWISPSFNFVVYSIMGAFYPDYLSNTSALLFRIKRKLNLFFIKRADPVLKNIYSLSIFMHFAGCQHLMHDVSCATRLQERRR